MPRSIAGLFLAPLLLSMGMEAPAQDMTIRLAEPVAVPTDFLLWLDQDADWLKSELAGQNAGSGYAIEGEILTAETVEALKAANRIRSFAYLAAPGLRPPYFDMTFKSADGDVRCVTLFPDSLAADIGPMDYKAGTFDASASDPVILDLCRVDASKQGAFEDVDRQTYADLYYDVNGDLKIEFSDLAQNAAFLAAAIDHGYFLTQGDVTGRPRIE